MSPNDGWEPYRKAHAYLVPAADGRCDNCGRTHVQTWFYGRGDDDSWWGYCTWFVREVPRARVGCRVTPAYPPQPRGLARWAMMVRGAFSRLEG